MKSKLFKIILIISIILLLFTNFALATEENTIENNITPEEALSQAATVTSVTGLSNLPEANLGLNNILNVLLLAVGVLLILFAIAILIRLKNNK